MGKRHEDKHVKKRTIIRLKPQENRLSFIHNQGNANQETHETGKRGSDNSKWWRNVLDRNLVDGGKTCRHYFINLSIVYPIDQQLHS